jgi:hypothetical protein
MSVPIPLRQDFDAPQLRGVAKKTKDGPQARRLLARTNGRQSKCHSNRSGIHRAVTDVGDPGCSAYLITAVVAAGQKSTAPHWTRSLMGGCL